MRPKQIMLMLAYLFILGCLAACGGKSDAPTTGAPAPEAKVAGNDPNKLVIVSPHDEAIKHELTPVFRTWYAKQYPGKPVPEIEWQDRGGSVEINKYLMSAYSALGDKKSQGIGIDLYFGGGTPAHAQLKAKGLSAPVQLDPTIMQAIPAQLAGVNLRDPDNCWFGVVLSSFGIIYNKPGLKAKSLPEPTTWADLANPNYYNTLILADPAKSGSARVCYEVILQKHGWEQGWSLLMQIAGNTREFATGSSAVPREVAQGSALAGMCVDYYAYSQIAKTGADVLGYVSPANATAVTPDPIGMLAGAPHPELAKAFITFTLSSTCQDLFGLKMGAPGGPAKDNLFRMPILPEFYKHDASTTLVTSNPYSSTTSFNVNEKQSDQRAPIIGPLFTAGFLSNKAALQQAWQTVNSHPQQPELKTKFIATPFTEPQSIELTTRYTSSPREAIGFDRTWQEAFKARYEEIQRTAK